MGGGYGSAISVIPFWLAVSSLLFSTAIGIIAGYYPARRAMRMSALESLRNE
jgi:ABC-type antimicrobial peptide transport system permease subunit